MVIFPDRNLRLPPTILPEAGTTNQRKQSQEPGPRDSIQAPELSRTTTDSSLGCPALGMILALNRPVTCVWGSREGKVKVGVADQLFVPAPCFHSSYNFLISVETDEILFLPAEDILSMRNQKHYDNYSFVSGNGATQGLWQSQPALRGRNKRKGTSPRVTALSHTQTQLLILPNGGLVSTQVLKSPVELLNLVRRD